MILMIVLRGLLKIASQFLEDRSEQEKDHEEIEKARLQLQETSNYNAFYRRMELLESREKVLSALKGAIVLCEGCESLER